MIITYYYKTFNNISEYLDISVIYISLKRINMSKQYSINYRQMKILFVTFNTYPYLLCNISGPTVRDYS